MKKVSSMLPGIPADIQTELFDRTSLTATVFPKMKFVSGGERRSVEAQKTVTFPRKADFVFNAQNRMAGTEDERAISGN